MKKELNMPIWEKYVLTPLETCAYFSIGQAKLDFLIRENQDADWLLKNGVYRLIKRKKFEEFIDQSDVI